MWRGVRLVNAWSFAAAVIVVSALTALVRSGVLPLHAFAATPRAVGDGRIWLLLTNALVADDPVVVSLVAFAVLGAAALVVCGPRLTAIAAIAGHVGATALVYLALVVVRAASPGAFADLVDRKDFGVSAILAAWLGACAATLWRRHTNAQARIAVVAVCAAAAALGWTLDTRRSFLDADHVVAFGIGAALAVVLYDSVMLSASPLDVFAHG